MSLLNFGVAMIQVTNRGKRTHQRFSELDNKIFSAFCSNYKVNWIVDFKDDEDKYCPIDVQLTGITKSGLKTYDVEIKSVHLNKLLSYCYFEREKWFQLCKYDNDIKLYFVIYPNLNIIAVWKVNSTLLEKSEKDIVMMNRETCKSNTKVEKQVYKFLLSDAKVFQFDLTSYKKDYNALVEKIKKRI